MRRGSLPLRRPSMISFQDDARASCFVMGWDQTHEDDEKFNILTNTNNQRCNAKRLQYCNGYLPRSPILLAIIPKSTSFKQYYADVPSSSRHHHSDSAARRQSNPASVDPPTASYQWRMHRLRCALGGKMGKVQLDAKHLEGRLTAQLFLLIDSERVSSI